MRALNDQIVDGSSASAAGATELPRAATVVIVRDGDTGAEILLLRRPDRGSFAGAWVFPGGKVEPGDLTPGADEDTEPRNAAVRETKEEVDLSVAGADLICISTWDPPQNLAVRIRTWFFLAPAFSGEILAQPSEVEEVRWITASDMLALHAAGEVTLYPPTFVTLSQLDGASSVAELTARFSGREPEGFSTHLRRQGENAVFRWQGDYEYDQDLPDSSGPLHRIVAGPVPWVYERS